jgi:hypothetical protein
MIKIFLMATIGEALYTKFIGGSYDGYFFHRLAVDMVASTRSFIDLVREVDFTIGASGSNNFAGLIASFYHFSISEITVAHMFMAAISVLALAIGYRTFSIAFPQADVRFFIVPIAFLPGAFVFSSLVLKDAPTMLFGMSFFYGLAVFFRQSRLRGAVLIIVALYLMMLVRVYLGFLLIAALVVGFAPLVFRIRAGFFTPIVRLAGVGVLLLSAFTLSGYANDVFIAPLRPAAESGSNLSRLETMAVWKATVARQKAANLQHSGLHSSGVTISTIRDFAYVPGEMISVFFRPFVWEIYNLNSFVASIENAFLFLASLKILTSIRRLWKSYGPDPIILTSGAFVLLFGISFTLVLGNIGTAFRIKMITYPFLMALFALAMSARPVVVPAIRSKTNPFRRNIGLPE